MTNPTPTIDATAIADEVINANYDDGIVGLQSAIDGRDVFADEIHSMLEAATAAVLRKLEDIFGADLAALDEALSAYDEDTDGGDHETVRDFEDREDAQVLFCDNVAPELRALFARKDPIGG
ncbi:hypothetical protein [Agromyces humi]|uniref:hypothetical protein n=1 Tax=Agromyces humi TaxID=1766800 RepID=UPI00135CCF36|nr:hypothetical protein [Agromyces humi]